MKLSRGYMRRHSILLFILGLALTTISGCTRTFDTGPITPEEERRRFEEIQTDNYLLTILAIIPGIVIASQ